MALGWTGITRESDYDFSAEAYYKWVRNVYDYRDGKSFYSEIEIERLLLGGKGRAYGLELCAHKNKGRLTGWLSYTLSWSENKIAGINNGEWYTASNDRRHDFCVIGIYQASPSWELSAMWRYNTGQAHVLLLCRAEWIPRSCLAPARPERFAHKEVATVHPHLVVWHLQRLQPLQPLCHPVRER